MRNRLTTLCILVLMLNSCTKQANEKKACWQGYQPYGGRDGFVLYCDKTFAEAQALQPNYWFYDNTEALYCWKTKRNDSPDDIYLTDVPQSIASKYDASGIYTPLVKVDCSSFCRWEMYEKHKSKITGLYTPTFLLNEIIPNADSCSKLFAGKVVIYRETTDSIITREFIRKIE